ncbi:HD-GYP domain-containing protein [Marinicrinis lubricantis]|uniref:HD-GYP domain-containing protein n=1 Tax=Marinicrinis lubricantis TaxID=2086470 RepID=A0ABW1IV87_9BACL
MFPSPLLMHHQLKPYMDEALTFLLRRLKNHHLPSYQHTLTAAELSLLFSEATRMTEDEKQTFIRSVLAHDLGVLHLSSHCLRDFLIDRRAWETYKEHPALTMQIVEHFQIGNISEEMVLYHHEHLDGSGFPFQVKWDELSYEVRVLTIIDAFATILGECSPHFKLQGLKSRIEELYIWNDIMFDKEILEHFTAMLQSIFSSKSQKK